LPHRPARATTAIPTRAGHFSAGMSRRPSDRSSAVRRSSRPGFRPTSCTSSRLRWTRSARRTSPCRRNWCAASCCRSGSCKEPRPPTNIPGTAAVTARRGGWTGTRTSSSRGRRPRSTCRSSCRFPDGTTRRTCPG
jgi:hypothetical protein